jgi:tripartite-type tricarboxylate transporter receptor subunit TctC
MGAHALTPPRRPDGGARLRAWLAAGLLGLGTGLATAQGFPSRPVQLTVPFAAGGSTDSVARALAAGLQGRLGQPVIVENVAGGGGTFGLDQVAKSAPDGHRLLVGGAELVREGAGTLAPVGLIGSSPSVVAVRADVGPLPGPRDKALNAAAARYVDGLLLRQLTRQAALVVIPYRGVGPALTDLAEGPLDLFVGDFATLRPLLDAGRARLIAATSQPPGAAERVPGLAQAGLAPLRGESFLGLFAPQGTPPATVDALARALRAALDDEALRRKLAGAGFVARPGGAEALRAAMDEVQASIPNPCRIKSECERDPGCNPPACPAR